MATLSPAWAIMLISFSPSPKAMISSRAKPYRSMVIRTPTPFPPSRGTMSTPFGCQRVWVQPGITSRNMLSSPDVTRGTKWYTLPSSIHSRGHTGYGFVWRNS